jgi:hypothetical protein
MAARHNLSAALRHIARHDQVPPHAVACRVWAADRTIVIDLSDGRSLFVRPEVTRRLSTATLKQLRRCQIIAGGQGLHWPELDEELSVAGLLDEAMEMPVVRVSAPRAKLDPNAPGLDEATRRRRRALAEMQRMSTDDLFKLAVRAGIYTKSGKLAKHYRDDGEPSRHRPTD